MRWRAGIPRLGSALLCLGLVECDTQVRRAAELAPSPREADGGEEAPLPPPVPVAPGPSIDAGPLSDAGSGDHTAPELADAGGAPLVDSSIVAKLDAAPEPHDASVAATDAGAPRFSQSGRLLVDRALFLDWDIANPIAHIGSNGAIANPEFATEAQPLTSPSRLVGYLGPRVPDASTRMRSDDVDVYRVDLVAGASVTLATAARPTLGAPADLDLYLLDENSSGIQAGGSWVDDSMGVDGLEQVVAPSTGTYWIVVERSVLESGDESREAVYRLDVGIPQSTPTQEAVARVKLSSSWPSLPEVLVPKAQSTLVERALRAFDTSEIRWEHRSELHRLKLSLRTLREAVDRRDVVRVAKRLRRNHAEFAKAAPNYLYQVSGTASDPSYPDQWHLAQIEIEGAWDATRKVAGAELGEGVLVAVIDTGVAFEHEDWIASDGSSPFAEGGIDLVTPFGQDDLPDLAGDGDGIDLDPTDPGELNDTEPGYHGTHIAGIIAAATDNGLGVASVAPNVLLLPIRAFGRGGDSAVTDVVEAIRYAAGLDNASGMLPPRRADIINMSFSGPKSELVAQACADARAQGVLLIGAVGNAGTLAMSYSPGATEGVVGVGASIDDLRHATYSNVGPEVDITAPGGHRSSPILSLGWDDAGSSYFGYHGTSMATAQISGVAALMKAVWPAMTPDDFDASLASGALTRDLGEPEWDQDYGHGLVDATRAVLAASNAAGTSLTAEVVLRVTPPVLDFGGDADELTLLLENAGDAFGELDVERIDSDEPWLTVLPGGVGENIVRLDRAHRELEEGAARATLFISSNGGERVVEVRAFTLPRAQGGDVGPLLVEVFLDGGVLDSVVAEAVSRDGGSVEYPYAFTDLPRRRFGIRAGTDVAAAGLLGQAGDLYGRKPPTSASSDAGVEGSLVLDLVAPDF